MKDKKPLQVSIDGVRRFKVMKINLILQFCLVFTDAGAETLKYLRSITIESSWI